MSRLARAFRADGHHVGEFTLDDYGLRRELRPSYLAERFDIFTHNGFSRERLFKVSTARYGKKGIVKDILSSKPDAIVLGWINQGLLSLEQIEQLAQADIPLIWVMHDLWPMTGICHLPLGCKRFADECGRCKYLASDRSDDLSHQVWERKRHLYKWANIKFVAVSGWVEEMARKSSLLSDADIRVIHNVFPIEDYRVGEKEPQLIVMGAARLDDPIKGLPQAIEALNRSGDGVRVEFFGEMRRPEMFNALTIGWRWHGPMGKAQLIELMSSAKVVMSSSQTETFGLTLLEGQASGALAVSFDGGGQKDIIDHMRNGYLAKNGDTADLARGLRWALDAAVSPEMLREDVAKRFSSKAIAEKFYALMQ